MVALQAALAAVILPFAYGRSLSDLQGELGRVNDVTYSKNVTHCPGMYTMFGSEIRALTSKV
jgi:hypothetical protein